MKPLKRVLIMAGGTGGHVFPGLAVARQLNANGVEVHWLGTSSGLEARLVPAENIPLHIVNVQGLRGKGIRKLLSAPLRLAFALRQSLSVINKIKPDVVMGMGGFVSGPGGLASWLASRPLIIHEQNAKAGLTNKVLAHFARRVLEGFPDAFRQQAKVMAVGNPVRSEMEAFAPPHQRFQTKKTPFRLLIIGGSLGAQGLNDIVPRALALLKEEERPEVWHQTGEKHLAAAQQTYAELGVKAKLMPFIDDMPAAYQFADMVLCRAGASTIAELCTVGLGAILVPYPFAVDDHQTANADFMVKNGAARCIQQSALTDTLLADIIREFSAAPEKRLAMAEAAYQLRMPDVAARIYQILCEVVN